MAEITSYRPSCNAIQALDTCLLNSSWMEYHQPWELGEATRSFMNNNNNNNNINMEQLEHLAATSGTELWKMTAAKLVEHDESATTFKEPTSVLDLQTSSLSSQHSFNSVSDGTSTAIQTVTDQLLSDEQDSAFLMESTTITAKPANSNNMLMDQDILTWMELMRDSEHSTVEVPDTAALAPDLQEHHTSQHTRQQEHFQGINRHVEVYSCTDMDLDDFEVGTMESITNTPHSSHVEPAPFAASPPPPEPQQVLCQQGALAASSMPESARNQIFSHNSTTLLSQPRAGSSYQQDVVTSVESQGTTLPSMFDSITAIPASQLQNYTVVPTAELLRLLSSQNPAPPSCVAGRLGANFANDQPPASDVEMAADRRGGQQWTAAKTRSVLPAVPHHNFRRTSTTAGVPPDQENGLHLVHLLLACAEAIDLCENTIAEPMLARLRSISDPEGDPMQRIALYFAEALSERLASEMAPPSPSHGGSPVKCPVSEAAASALERDIAYQAYYQILPFQKFTHFTANQALLEVVADYPCVHIVDFNIRQGLQWPSFMQSLALLPQGPPRLRITAVQLDGATARKTGNRLAEFARSLQVPFEFHIIEENLETFHRGMVCPRADEALAVNCSDILHSVLRKEGKLHSLLCKIRSLRPVVVTVLEADANHNVPSFMARFVQALHYYCALFDSLEATLHRTSMERLRIEHLCFGAEIRSIVALEGVDREVRHVRAEAWQALFQQAGFQEVPVSRYAADQAQLLLSLYETSDNMPFRLSPEFGGLSLGWQETPVMVVSSWTC
ncbi:hypothetical protein M758_9G013000 [Ceratodon purpureus]|uniref:Uncharacterized protein n=1 Tax=Ceratodon purpureus TaxID=3225 RepID=A0A8T0GR71_CERPU|nr:hypothetical protein KC19_9G013400 [Ceratodon purpureus]KAG0604848.1 hypothetical protein M758_9G013000 [Ceratodon purpureus]